MSTGIPSWLKRDDTAIRYVYKHMDTNAMDQEEVEDIVGLYVGLAQKVQFSGEVEIYRAISVPFDGKNVRFNIRCLGKSWSALRRGVGVYGRVPHSGDMKTIVIAAVVKPSSIDWEFGMQSFLYYGEEQWEVSLKPNKPVILVEVDGVRLIHPLKANTGGARESWNEKDCSTDVEAGWHAHQPTRNPRR